MYRSIEIRYKISRIPGAFSGRGDDIEHALGFRNDAMRLVEKALEAKGLGEWAGAEIGMGEVNFGFEVKDFDAAEAAVRKTVAGTKYEDIRQIARFEMPG